MITLHRAQIQQLSEHNLAVPQLLFAPSYEMAAELPSHVSDLVFQVIAATADTVALIERPGFGEGEVDGKVDI